MAKQQGYLSARFQQIMDLAYKHGKITAADLERDLPGNPSNSTVRTQLRVLEERGLLVRFDLDGRYGYKPAKPRPSAAKQAMQRFLQTFVDGSLDRALTTLLSAKETDLTDEDIDRLQAILDEAKQKRQNHA